jgi:hypothetical protein
MRLPSSDGEKADSSPVLRMTAIFDGRQVRSLPFFLVEQTNGSILKPPED